MLLQMNRLIDILILYYILKFYEYLCRLICMFPKRWHCLPKSFGFKKIPASYMHSL
jgi:hypothetical protein